MSHSRVAGGLDRLPWLSDEPVRTVAPSRRRGWDVTGWAVSAVLIVGGFSFWLGSRTPRTEDIPQTTAVPSTTVVVPEPRSAPTADVQLAPQPQVAPVREPQVRVVRVPEVRIVPAPGAAADARDSERPTADSRSEPSATADKPAAAVSPPVPKVAAPAALKPWPPRVVAGASGRLVQIGADGSRIQAKRGWVAMSRAYPALKRLPAVVAVTRNSKGRLSYRFQIGTTSQAHSEILCQRMQRIDLSCAVVGLPWKSKVER